MKAAYPAIKLADPTATVVLGGTSYNDTGYLAALYADGIHGSFDVLATHPYQGVADDPPTTADDGTEYTLAHVAAVHALMVQHGDTERPDLVHRVRLVGPHQPAGRPELAARRQRQPAGRRRRRRRCGGSPSTPRTSPTPSGTRPSNETGTDVQNANYGLLTTDLAPKASYTILRQYLTQSG